MKTKLFLASTLLFAASVSSAFATAEWVNYSAVQVNGTWYNCSSNNSWCTGGSFNNADLGTISELKIGGQSYVKDYNNISWGGGTMTMGYSIDGVDHTHTLTYKSFDDTYKTMCFESGGQTFTTEEIDISGLNGGKHTLAVWFTSDDKWDSNNGNNYVATFTIDKDITLNANEDNSATIVRNNNYTGTVTLDNFTIFSDGFWNTICLPFNIDNLAGTIFEEATVYTLTGSSFSNGTLTLNFGWTYNNNIQCINAGVPYIVKWSSKKDDISNPTFYNVTIATSTPSQAGGEGPAIFKGCFNSITIPEEGSENTDYLYLGAENTLFYPETSVTIGAFRGYFELNIPEPEANPIKAFVLNFDDDNETTSIQEISNTTNTSNAIFTLDGRRINGQPATAGLYIINGKKVMIK